MLGTSLRAATLAATLALTLPATAGAAPGALDPTFGDAGAVRLQLSAPPSGSTATAVLALPDARLASAGWSVLADGTLALTVARHLESGALDSGFGSSGVARVEARWDGDAEESIAYGTFRALALGRQDRIVAAGYAGREVEDEDDIYEEEEAALSVFTATGKPDPAFGEGGTLREQLGVGTPRSQFADVLVQPDGKIVAAGAAFTAGTQQTLLVVRYLPNGRRDPDFGTGGVVRLQYGRGNTPASLAQSVALLPDGKLVIGGAAGDDSMGERAGLVVRLSENGAPDTGFGPDGDGGLRLALGDISVADAFVNDVAVDSGRRVLVAGSARYAWEGTTRIDAAIARVTADGAPDPAFGANGVTRFAAGLSTSPTSAFYALARQAGGKVVAAGSAMDETGWSRTLLARFDAAGKPDTGFGTLTPQLGLGSVGWSGWNALTLDSEARIVAAGAAGGEADEALPTRWTLARFRADEDLPTGPRATPDAAAPSLRLPKRAPVNRRGVARLRLRCTSPVPCRGVLRLTHRGRTIGRVSLRIKAETRRTVRVRLNATGRPVTRRNRQVTVRAVVTLTRAPAAPVTARGRIVLRRSGT